MDSLVSAHTTYPTVHQWPSNATIALILDADFQLTIRYLKFHAKLKIIRRETANSDM